ncbi:MAG: CHAT domain-containing protein [Bacteroidetes bacterium]|nr:MAG: CHAT domain-containing protein [Bacteroidota bacterium]
MALLGKEEHSEKYLKQSIEVSELTTQIQYDFLSELNGFEAARMTYSEDIHQVLQYQAVASQALYELTGQEKYLYRYFEVTERRKGMTLLQILTPSPLPEAVAAKEEKLLYNFRMLQQKTETAGADSLAFFQDKLFDATREYEAFVTQLRQGFPKRANAFYNVEYATISDVQDLLEEDECYIDYSYNESNLYILSISKESVELVEVGAGGQFEEALTRMQALLKDPLLMQSVKKTAFIETSRQLYEYLISPVAHRIKSKSKIIIAPEKKLFYLPFEVLLQTDEIKRFENLDYLVKKYAINYEYSATTFRQLQQRTVIKDNSFLAFAPVFENEAGGALAARNRETLPDSLYRSVEGDHFRPLPNSRKEVSSIAKMIPPDGQTNILMDEGALKKDLRGALTSRPWQFVHIATHGIVNFNNPTLSALACYEKEPSDEQLLYANEIQLLDLQADLVVLSSCESGIGRLVKGEGLLALSRSFLYAGAKNVLFSLWKVNDRHTSTLMINFYKFYAEGSSYPEALRKTKLEMLKNPITANPRFWGAFVLIGK